MDQTSCPPTSLCGGEPQYRGLKVCLIPANLNRHGLKPSMGCKNRTSREGGKPKKPATSRRPVTKYLSHENFVLELDKDIKWFLSKNGRKIHVGTFTFPLTGTANNGKAIKRLNEGTIEMAKGHYPCIRLNIENRSRYRKYFAGKDGQYLSDVGLKSVKRLIVECSQSVKVCWKPGQGYDFTAIQEKFTLKQTVEDEIKREEVEWKRRANSEYAKFNIATRLVQDTTSDRCYGDRQHTFIDTYDRKNPRWPEILKQLPPSLEKDNCRGVGRKPILLIVSDEMVRNMAVTGRVDLNSPHFDVAVVSIARCCFKKRDVQNIFHLNAVKSLRPGDFLWINLGINNAFLNEDTRKPFIYRPKDKDGIKLIHT